MPKSKKTTQYLFVLPGINTEKIDIKYNLSNNLKFLKSYHFLMKQKNT